MCLPGWESDTKVLDLCLNQQVGYWRRNLAGLMMRLAYNRPRVRVARSSICETDSSVCLHFYRILHMYTQSPSPAVKKVQHSVDARLQESCLRQRVAAINHEVGPSHIARGIGSAKYIGLKH